MDLLVDELKHAISYLIFVLAAYLIFGFFNLYGFLLGFVVTIFIDADHLVDYFLSEGFHLNLHKFFSGVHFKKTHRVFVVAHGWEYVFVLLVILIFLKNPFYKILLTYVIIGMAAHLIYDSLHNRPKWFAYFFVGRAIHKFNGKLFGC